MMGKWPLAFWVWFGSGLGLFLGGVWVWFWCWSVWWFRFWGCSACLVGFVFVLFPLHQVVSPSLQ